MASRYSRAVRRVAGKTGRSYRRVQKAFVGNPDALYRASRSKQPKRNLARAEYEARLIKLSEIYRTQNRSVLQEAFHLANIAPNRIRSFIVDPEERFKGIAPKKWVPHAKLLRKGPNKGKYCLTYDTTDEKVLTREGAKKLRVETRAERIAAFMVSRKFHQYRRLHKYFTKAEIRTIKKRKSRRPTVKELRRVAFRMSRNWGRKLFRDWRELSGEYA